MVIADKSGKFQSRLVKIDRPILRIPNLAIHRERSPRYVKVIGHETDAIAVNRGAADNFQFNLETEYVPITGLVEAQLNESPKESAATNKSAADIQGNHHPALLALLADHLSVSPEFIHDFELYGQNQSLERVQTLTSLPRSHLYDTQPAVLGGLNNEFIFAPRLDNQFSSSVLHISFEL